MERVMISLPVTLLDRVDQQASELNENRSEFVRTALVGRLAELQRRAFDERLAEGYAVMSDELAAITAEAEGAQAVAAQLWHNDDLAQG